MKNLAKIRDEHEGAFTLVELLVVILIIGILAAIAIPAFLNQRKAAVDSSVESDVKNASTQIETWAVSNSNEDVPPFTIVGEGATGTTTAGLTSPLSDIEVGEGTVITVASTGNTGEYRIQGVNPDGNRADAAVDTAALAGGILFDSTSGGMK